jgi:selenocysteine lyase/cysteine desulfurase
MTLDCLRDLFEIPSGTTYLNAAAMLPSTKLVRIAGERGVARKSAPWEIGWPDYFTEVDIARGEFAKLIGAKADDIAIIPSVSYGAETAAKNLPLGHGQTIVMLAGQFPSNFYAWQNLAAAHGGALIEVRCPDNWDWTQAVCDAIDDRTRIVALPHCHWTNGVRLDLARIAAHARAVGAALSLDLTQSLGVLPLDVAEVRPDFLIVASYKWLMGPYGVAYLYAAAHRQDGVPIENTPFARAGVRNPPDDKGTASHHLTGFMPGARRYDVGETANFALMPMSIAATRQLLDLGPERIAATLRPLVEHAAERATALGLDVPPASVRSPHMLGCGLPVDSDPVALANALTEERIYVSLRSGNLRISPHLYNDMSDIDRLFDVLEEML